MSNSELVGASFIDGLRAPHYINGRLLAAEDLKADQEANLTRMAWLGKAAGYGIVEGLAVEQTGNNLRVQKGLGLNREGQPIRLPSAITLSLQLTADEQQIADAGRFHTCALKSPGSPGGIAGGAYLLTALPVARLEGAAPLKGSAGSAATPGCAAKWEVEGLQFKAIRLVNFSATATTDKPQISLLRNRLAHWCYGSEQLNTLPLDPFSFPAQYTGFDTIDAADLTPCDLPLAVFYWNGKELTFVDAWGARRRLVRAEPLESWYGVLDDRRAAAGQARFVQFQQHLDALKTQFQLNPASVSAKEYFERLPPVGFLPIGSGNFDLTTFFTDVPIERIGFVGFDFISRRLAHSLCEEPIDLRQPGSIVLYIVPEILQSMFSGRGIKGLAASLSSLSVAAGMAKNAAAHINAQFLGRMAQLEENEEPAAQPAAKVQPYLVFARDEQQPLWLDQHLAAGGKTQRAVKR